MSSSTNKSSQGSSEGFPAKPGDRASVIQLQKVAKSFPGRGADVEVLRNVSLSVDENSFVSIVGPSGCGKTTLLNLVAGFLAPSQGSIHVRGTLVHGINSDLGLGYITQDNKLFPWLTLAGNVEFPLRARHLPREKRQERVANLLEMVGLRGFEEHYPYQLSGGMQKRTALAQALSYDPDVLLMDEPFGSLDAQTRMLLQQELLKIWKRTGKTILFVTHDIVEALALSDRVVVMSRRPGSIKGQLEVSLSRPRDVFHIHDHDGYGDCHRELWRLLRSELPEH